MLCKVITNLTEPLSEVNFQGVILQYIKQKALIKSICSVVLGWSHYDQRMVLCFVLIVLFGNVNVHGSVLFIIQFSFRSD